MAAGPRVTGTAPNVHRPWSLVCHRLMAAGASSYGGGHHSPDHGKRRLAAWLARILGRSAFHSETALTSSPTATWVLEGLAAMGGFQDPKREHSTRSTAHFLLLNNCPNCLKALKRTWYRHNSLGRFALNPPSCPKMMGPRPATPLHHCPFLLAVLGFELGPRSKSAGHLTQYLCHCRL